MNEIDIETVDFQQSAVLERLILDLGRILYHSLIQAERYDELLTLSELTGEFTLLASSYSEKTMRMREDLGVSLNESVLLKISMVKRDAHSPDIEWKFYADQTKRTLDELEEKITPPR